MYFKKKELNTKNNRIPFRQNIIKKITKENAGICFNIKAFLKVRNLLLFIFFSIPVLVYAQNKQDNHAVELWLQELAKANDDTGKVTLLYNLALNYQETNPGLGIKYGETGLDLAEKLNWEKGIVITANLLGDNYTQQTKYAKALDCYFKALKINQESGHKLREAKTLRKIAVVYDEQDNYPLALESENKVLKITEDLQDKKGMAQCYGDFGGIYIDIAKHPAGAKPNNLISPDKKINLNKSIEYSNKSVILSEEVGDIEQLKIAYKNLYTSQKMSGNVKDALATYGKMMKLKHAALDPRKAKEIEQKQLEYEYGKREDSMRAQQKIAEEKIIEQQQLLQTTNKTLSATEKDKEKTQLALQQTQTDLTQEKSNSEEKEKKLTLAEEESALQAVKLQLQKNELQMKDSELDMHTKERYFYILGLIGLMSFSLLAYRSYRLQKRYNSALIKEKKRSEGLLLNILPFEVAEELMEKGFAEAKHFDNVTVLFTDFICFTSAAEIMHPKQLVGELHMCFKAFDEILAKYNIEKIKTIGDAYLAVSGLPAPNPDHAADVVAAAIEIRDFMQQRKLQLGDNTFSVRLGINSGSVVAGIVGVTKYAYDIWGDAVNIAARMEQCSDDGKINISESTYKLIKDKYKCEHRGKIEAKNKGHVDMYYLKEKHKIPVAALSSL